MRRVVVFLSILLCTTLVSAQNHVKEDAALFEKYCKEQIVPVVDLGILQGICKFWNYYDSETKKGAQWRNEYWQIPPSGATPGYTYNPRTFYVPGDQDLDYYIQQLKHEFQTKNIQPDSLNIEKNSLVRCLEAMDTLLHNKPLFFVTINSKPYKGNIRKYVDDMYKKSFMCSERNFKKMMRSTRPKRLLKDLGVNYSIGVALYKLWLKQQAEAADSTAVR